MTVDGCGIAVARYLKPDCMELAREALSGRRVLLVEDSGFLCFALEHTLRQVGCEVVGPCCRLNDAIAEASHHDLDCAVLDINLRGELVSPLAVQLRERGIPFVLASAYSEHELPPELASERQIRKPFTDTEVLATLASVMLRH
jgi:DNA-binding response OmpR family regulator